MTVLTSAKDGKPMGPRQAVVLIHGIGEQRPMGTLRAFVHALLEQGTFHSKPDTISDLYELRRIKLRRVQRDGRPEVNVDWPETDFYEYYWAHQMHGTTVGHLVNWLRLLMGRGAKSARDRELFSSRYPTLLKWLVAIAWLGMPLALVAVVLFAIWQPAAALSTTAAVVLLILWQRVVAPTLGTALLDVVGDAARYLDVAPKNVARRYDIIRGGVNMLRALHEDVDTDASSGGAVMFRYGRIVLVGHSLGSVIAYDLIRHYWAEVNGGIQVSPDCLDAIERFDGGNEMPAGSGIETHQCLAQFREDQSEGWRHVNSWWLGRPSVSGHEAAQVGRGRWLVTDLVTIGSPLTYAPLLLADGAADLAEKQRLRELPTCPPDRSRDVNKGRFVVRLSDEAERFLDYPIIGHQAPFAITRWTNLYFSNDPIGGKLAPAFLNGIEDHELDPMSCSWLSSHISYWKTKDQRPVAAAEACVQQLQKILKRNVMEA